MYNMYDNIIVDGNNVFNRIWFSKEKGIFDKKEKKLWNSEVIFSEPIETFILEIENLIKKYGKTKSTAYVLFDNIDSKEKYRKRIDPLYKKNRIKRESIFYKSIEYLQLFLLSYKDNFKLCYCNNVEADDLVMPVINKYINKKQSTLIVSDDFDWARCMSFSDKIHWLSQYEVYDRSRFEKKFGYSVLGKSIVMLKAFRGDNSDNIPNAVPYLPEEFLLTIIKNYSNIKELIDDLNCLEIPNSWKKKIFEKRARLELNYKLVDFLNIDTKDINKCLYTCKFEEKTLEKYYKMLKLDRLKEKDKRYTNDSTSTFSFKCDTLKRK